MESDAGSDDWPKKMDRSTTSGDAQGVAKNVIIVIVRFDPRPFIFICKQRFPKAVKPGPIFYLQANMPSNFVLLTFKRPLTIHCIIVAVPPAPHSVSVIAVPAITSIGLK
uniref:Uncharacterized protein n=1 Tax=Romanomermis culicivorax TaxID=13658 RepID=A0A915L310_ROMCU